MGKFKTLLCCCMILATRRLINQSELARDYRRVRGRVMAAYDGLTGAAQVYRLELKALVDELLQGGIFETVAVYISH